eukprot:4312534-Pyramimonas_sp.AAC.1
MPRGAWDSRSGFPDGPQKAPKDPPRLSKRPLRRPSKGKNLAFPMEKRIFLGASLFSSTSGRDGPR